LIGNERGWESALNAAGVRLRGHRLLRTTAAARDDRT
jgi:hypothetical protein